MEKLFEVWLECVGNFLVFLLKVNIKLELSFLLFYNKIEIEKFIRFLIYDIEVVMNGSIFELKFGILKSKFKLIFVLFVENFVGIKEYVFLVEVYCE